MNKEKTPSGPSDHSGDQSLPPYSSQEDAVIHERWSSAGLAAHSARPSSIPSSIPSSAVFPEGSPKIGGAVQLPIDS